MTPNKIAEFNTVRAVTQGYLYGRQEQTFDNYERYEWHCLQFVRQHLNLFTEYGIETFRGSTDAENNGQITLPVDFVKEVAVGWDNHGRLETIFYDNEIITGGPAQSTNGDGEETELGIALFPLSSGEIPFMYGVGQKEAAFTIDKKGKRMFVQPNGYGREIIIQYVSSGQDACGTTIIASPYLEAADRFIDYQVSYYAGDGAMEYKKRVFDIAMLKAAEADLVFTYSRLYQLFNATATVGPKRGNG